MPSMGDTVNVTLLTFMETDDYQTYYCDHFTMYTNVRSLYCTHETNTIWYVGVQLLSHVQLFRTPWPAACQASMSFTISLSLLILLSFESVMPSNPLVLCCPLLLLPSVFPSIRVFSNKSVLHIMWSKYWSFSLSISPSNKYFGLISFRIDWFVGF